MVRATTDDTGEDDRPPAGLGRDAPLPPATEVERLRERLAERADGDEVLDVAYRVVDTPFDRLLVATTPAGLVRVAFEREGLDDVLTTLAARLSPRIIAAPRRLDPVARQLDEYFAHRREAFDVPVDLSLATGFRRRVLEYLPTIGYGHTASYAVVAAGVDNPRAVRAVGTACATNPLPLLIPCHRVVRADGGMGQYLGGTENKRHLLDLEAAG
jgi:methylated-DNA-[protein]-cysteine S-methyltransferase